MPAGTQLNYIQYNAFPENYKKKKRGGSALQTR